MIDLSTTDDGVLLPVTAQPGARREGLAGVHDGRLKVAVTQAPEKGKANARIVRVLASSLGVKRSQVVLVRGQTSRQKTFLIQTISRDDLRRRLADELRQK